MLKRVKGIGLGAIPRSGLGSAAQALLGAIYKGWEVAESQSKIPHTMAGEASPFKQMIGKTYLSPLPAEGKESLVVMTVEKEGHAMGIAGAPTFRGQELPPEQMARTKQGQQSKKTGVKITGIKVFNQSFTTNNIQDYKNINPTDGGSISAVKQPEQTKPHKWAQPLNYINFYKLTRPFPAAAEAPHPEASIIPRTEPQPVALSEVITGTGGAVVPKGDGELKKEEKKD